jgi:hypothetical protein
MKRLFKIGPEQNQALTGGISPSIYPTESLLWQNGQNIIFRDASVQAMPPQRDLTMNWIKTIYHAGSFNGSTYFTITWNAALGILDDLEFYLRGKVTTLTGTQTFWDNYVAHDGLRVSVLASGNLYITAGDGATSESYAVPGILAATFFDAIIRWNSTSGWSAILNGVPAATQATSMAALSPNASNIYIGSNATPGNYVTGALDQIGIAGDIGGGEGPGPGESGTFTVVVYPARDTWVHSQGSGYGSSETISHGGNSSVDNYGQLLAAFDFTSEVPDSATITDVKLKGYCSSVVNGSGFRPALLTQDFIESATMSNMNGSGVAWNTAYISTIFSDDISALSLGHFSKTFNAAGIAAAQAKIASGELLLCAAGSNDEEWYIIGSSENTDTDKRLRLEITYEV